MEKPNEEVVPFLTPWRKALVLRVVDGDTFDLQIDLGFDVHTVTRIRLSSVDAYETRGVEKELGEAAARRVSELLPVGSEIRVLSKKGGARGKYGRWIAEVLYRVSDSAWSSLGPTLIKEGHASAYSK